MVIDYGMEPRSFDSAQDRFRGNDNVAVAATAKQKTLGETQG